MSGGRPEHDDSFWDALAARPWRRVRWRRDDASEEVCAAYGTPLHRAGTYYRRPVYTDGEVWLCQRAYDEMVRRTRGGRASRQTRPPRGPT